MLVQILNVKLHRHLFQNFARRRGVVVKCQILGGANGKSYADMENAMNKHSLAFHVNLTKSTLLASHLWGSESH